MTDEEFAEYRDGRYKRISDYYDVRAVENQRRYHICAVYILVVSIAIAPILAIDLISGSGGRILAAILSPTVALATGLAAHYRFHENWLNYRATWDALNHEVHLRDAKIGDYRDATDRNSLFVERVEKIVALEGSGWLARQASKEQKKA